MEIECKFYHTFVPSIHRLYTCVVTSAEISEPRTIVKAFNGTHIAGKRNEDVGGIHFFTAKVKHLPLGLPGIFPNLRYLCLNDTGLETLRRADLIGLQSLPSDLLMGMSKLRVMLCDQNQIEEMSSDLLKPVRNGLWCIDFRKNKNINACYYPWGINNSLSSIEDVMKTIDEKCIKPAENSSLDHHRD